MNVRFASKHRYGEVASVWRAYPDAFHVETFSDGWVVFLDQSAFESVMNNIRMQAYRTGLYQ